jgi:hypothetical protein
MSSGEPSLPFDIFRFLKSFPRMLLGRSFRRITRKATGQLFDITSGDLLNATNEAGKNLFKTPLYQTLTQYEEDYWSMLETSIEKHLSFLGVEKKTTHNA